MLRDNTDVVPGPVRGRRGAPASRCTAPTGSAPTRCSTSTSSAAAPASPPPSTPPTARLRRAARRRRRPVVDAWSSALLRRRTGAERVADDPQGAAGDDGRNAQVFRTEETLKQAVDGHRRAASERYTNVGVQDKGKRFNTDLLEAVELGFLLDLAEVLVVSALARNGVPRRPLPRGLPEPRRRQLHAPHDGLPRGRRRRRPTSIRLDYKPVVADPLPADGAEVLMTTATVDRRSQRRAEAVRATITVTLRIRRFNPEVDAEPHWERLPGRRRPDRPRARRPAQDQVGAGRHADLPPLLRARRLRLGRDAHQRPQPAGLQDAGQGPRPGRSRSPSSRSRACRSRRTSSSTWSRSSTRTATVMPFLITDGQRADARAAAVRRGPRALRRHHQVHPVRRVHDVLPGLLDRRPVLRPGRDRQRAPLHLRQPRRGGRASAWRSSTTGRACGAAARPSTAPRPARAASRSPRRSRRSSARCCTRRV